MSNNQNQPSPQDQINQAYRQHQGAGTTQNNVIEAMMSHIELLTKQIEQVVATNTKLQAELTEKNKLLEKSTPKEIPIPAKK